MIEVISFDRATLFFGAFLIFYGLIYLVFGGVLTIKKLKVEQEMDLAKQDLEQQLLVGQLVLSPDQKSSPGKQLSPSHDLNRTLLSIGSNMQQQEPKVTLFRAFSYGHHSRSMSLLKSVSN